MGTIGKPQSSGGDRVNVALDLARFSSPIDHFLSSRTFLWLCLAAVVVLAPLPLWWQAVGLVVSVPDVPPLFNAGGPVATWGQWLSGTLSPVALFVAFAVYRLQTRELSAAATALNAQLDEQRRMVETSARQLDEQRANRELAARQTRVMEREIFVSIADRWVVALEALCSRAARDIADAINRIPERRFELPAGDGIQRLAELLSRITASDGSPGHPGTMIAEAITDNKPIADQVGAILAETAGIVSNAVAVRLAFFVPMNVARLLQTIERNAALVALVADEAKRHGYTAPPSSADR